MLPKTVSLPTLDGVFARRCLAVLCMLPLAALPHVVQAQAPTSLPEPGGLNFPEEQNPDAVPQAPRLFTPDSSLPVMPRGGTAADGPLPGAQVLAPEPGQSPREIDRVVAVVNQTAIPRSEVESALALGRLRLREQNQAVPPDATLRRQVLDQLISAQAELQYATDNGMVPDDTEIDQAIAGIARNGDVSVDQLRTELASKSITFESYRDQIRREIISLRLREREGMARVSVSEGEIDAWLRKRGAGAQAGTEYEVSQILLRLPASPTQADIERQTRRAAEIRTELAQGTDFSALAKKYSDGPEAAEGGRLGWRTADRLPQLFVDALKPLKAGQVTDAVRSPAGLHVLLLDDQRLTQAAEEARTRTRVRHILLPATSASVSAASERKLAEFRTKVQAGEARFEELARGNSIDGSAAQGGDLGWVYASDLVPAFAQAMNKLQPGSLSEPVRSPFGWHLIEVLERKVDENASDRLRAQARQALREEKAGQAYLDWSRELRDSAYVDIRLNDRDDS